MDNCSSYCAVTFQTESCTPAPLQALDIPLSNKIKVCQVCHYEMQFYKRKSVALCSKYGVHFCTEQREARQKCESVLIKKVWSKVTDSGVGLIQQTKVVGTSFMNSTNLMGNLIPTFTLMRLAKSVSLHNLFILLLCIKQNTKLWESLWIVRQDKTLEWVKLTRRTTFYQREVREM